MAVDRRPFVFNVFGKVVRIFDSEGTLVAEALAPISVESPNAVPVVTGTGGNVAIVFRHAASAFLLTIDVESKAIATAELRLDDVASPEVIDIVGVRGDVVLANVAANAREIWALRADADPAYVTGCSRGHVLAPAMGRLGLALLGDGPGQLVDLRGGRDLELKSDQYYLGRLSEIHYVIRSLTDMDFPLSRLPDAGFSIEWDLSRRSNEWISNIGIDKIDGFQFEKFITGRRGSAEFFVFKPFRFAVEMDLKTASQSGIVSIYRENAIKRRNQWIKARDEDAKE